MDKLTDLLLLAERTLYPELPEIAAFFGRWYAALAALSQSASDGSQSP